MLWTSDLKGFVMGSVFDDHWLFSCNDNAGFFVFC